MIKNAIRAAVLAIASGAVALPVQAQSVAGPYLAGRHAAVNSDYVDAARYYTDALAQDPDNAELMESATLSLLSLGDVERALPLAQRLEEQNMRSQVARLVTTAALAKAGNYQTLLDRDGDPTGIGPWVDGLVRAWAFMGVGDVSSAIAIFDDLSEEPGMQGLVMYHKGLALGSVGDYESAAEIFGEGLPGSAGQTRRGVMAHAEILSQLGRFDEALTLLRSSFGASTDPELDQMIANLEAGETVPFTHVPDPLAGMAEVFFTFASVLRSEDAGDYYVLLYSRVARYLRPEHLDALLLTADLLENLGQHGLAIEEYADVPADDPAYHAAELGRAEALRRSGKQDQAIEVLTQLSRSHGDLAVVHSTLGDIYRAQENWTSAVAAYDRALDRVAKDNPMRWVLLYSRGIAQERLGNMDTAEADFRAALEINPEQPQVLNYLGYSLVEQQRNMDEALDMIERAVAASPDSGYIVDSLGWVFYRMGRYEEAEEQMERAVQLEATDPVVNDHLGDVYWAVGRKREAEFQWSRALSFIDPEDTDGEADPDRIRRKLDVGLDQVLQEEGAPPLKLSNDI